MSRQETKIERTSRSYRSRRRATGGGYSLLAQGEPMVWLTGGSLAIAVVMIVGLIGLILWQGGTTFWPRDVVRIETIDGDVLVGEITRDDTYTPLEEELEALDTAARDRAARELQHRDGVARRRLVRTGNFDITGRHFDWVTDFRIEEETHPRWAIVMERLSWGRFYGEPVRFELDGEMVAEGPEESWARFREHHGAVRERFHRIKELETDDIGRVNHEVEKARLEMRQAALDHGEDSPAYRAARERAREVEARSIREYDEIQGKIAELRDVNDRFEIVMTVAMPILTPVELFSRMRK